MALKRSDVLHDPLACRLDKSSQGPPPGVGHRLITVEEGRVVLRLMRWFGLHAIDLAPHPRRGSQGS